MRSEVLNFIQSPSFPCIMAKAVAQKGHLEVHETTFLSSPESIKKIQNKLYQFIDIFRQNPERLSSFILVVHDECLDQFSQFEKKFFHFLKQLHHEDKILYPHDPLVSSNVNDNKFSYSIKSEAFFLVALHPHSPRWSRRFKYPAIVFNPHIQFEKMRKKKIFDKIKNIIRAKDKILQGTINPMLNDFGERSEVFQYIGRAYHPQDKVPLEI